jgi:hypothetical protein
MINFLMGVLSWIAGKLLSKPAGPSVADTENQALGAARAAAAGAAQAARTAGAVAQAEANAPNTADAVAEAMRQGRF